MKRISSTALLTLLLGILYACGSGGTPATNPKDAFDLLLDGVDEASPQEETEAVGEEGESLLDAETSGEEIPELEEGILEEVREDAVDAEDVQEEDVGEEEVAGCPGASGCPCEKNSDCDTGFCVITRDGKACAYPCSTTEGCPEGYECVAANLGGDLVDICMDKYARLCEPCVNDGDCTIPFFSRKSHCVDYGPQGRFCGGECNEDDDCPEGYKCTEVRLASGQTGIKQCVPREGVCSCSGLAIEDMASTICYQENEYGRCEGTRTCTKEGLSECTAPQPQPEDCNGLDDDCDGQTDEGLSGVPCERSNEFGTCTGTRDCVNGSWSDCTAKEPQKEVCNGLDDNCDGKTDEGFEDTDGDGRVDCVDLDDDGDGVPDKDDNCPLTPNPQQIDTDEDGKGDACDPDDDGDGDPDETDCAPQDNRIHHGAQEICNDKDDDCDGDTDEDGARGCVTVYLDNDGDGYGSDETARCMCKPQSPYTTRKGGDCDDAKAAVHPGTKEHCNGIDDNCDGIVDENCNPDLLWVCPVGGGGTLGVSQGPHGLISVGIVPAMGELEEEGFRMSMGIAPITLIDEEP